MFTGRDGQQAADRIGGLVAPGEVLAHGDAAPDMVMFGVGIGTCGIEPPPAGNVAGPSGSGPTVISRVTGSRRDPGRSG